MKTHKLRIIIILISLMLIAGLYYTFIFNSRTVVPSTLSPENTLDENVNTINSKNLQDCLNRASDSEAQQIIIDQAKQACYRQHSQ